MPKRSAKPKGPKPSRPKRPKLTKRPPSATPFSPSPLQRAVVKEQLARGAPPDAIARAIFYPDSLRLVSLAVFKRAFREELKVGVLETRARVYNGMMAGVADGKATCATFVYDRIMREEHPYDGKRHFQLEAEGTTPSGDHTAALSLEQLVELRGEVARLVAEIAGQHAARGSVAATMDEDRERETADA